MAEVIGSRALRVSLVGEALVEPIVVAAPDPAELGSGESGWSRVDGTPTDLLLERRDASHAVLVAGGASEQQSAVIMAVTGRARPDRRSVREVVVDGWRFEVEVELASRAALRERAGRGVGQARRAGAFEVRAVIPGRVLSVAVVPGDVVHLGQSLLIVEAMKMQNEVRAPHDGSVIRVEAAVGGTVEVGNVLVVLE